MIRHWKAESPRESGSFFDELMRRKVVRVAIVYAAVAFAAIEAADIIVPRLNIPDWTVTVLIVLALLGFPIALALAWAFDIAPRAGRVVATLVASALLLVGAVLLMEGDNTARASSPQPVAANDTDPA